MKELKTYTDFFKYYIGILDSKLPKWQLYMTMKSSTGGNKRVHREFPQLNKEQVIELNTKLRELVSFPKSIILSYQPKTETWYAQYNSKKGKYTINYPTLSYYWLAYPSMLKTVLLHELGHIFNGDTSVRNTSGHASCTNICMDVRCNAPLDRESLRQINDSLFFFEIKRPQGLYVPEEFYPKVGLAVLPQGWSFEETHNAYHLQDYDDDEEEEPKKSPPWIPQIGNFVIITSGSNLGKIARIKNILPSQECEDFYTLISQQPSSCSGGSCGVGAYNEDIDYDIVQRCEFVLESISPLEELVYTKQIKPSEIDKYLLNTANASSVVSSGLIYGNYFRVDFSKIDPIEEPPPTPECECKDANGELNGVMSSECCPPPPTPPLPPKPQPGDLVLTKGGEYGKIISVKGGEDKEKYTIDEVPVEVVNSILGTKLK